MTKRQSHKIIWLLFIVAGALIGAILYYGNDRPFATDAYSDPVATRPGNDDLAQEQLGVTLPVKPDAPSTLIVFPDGDEFPIRFRKAKMRPDDGYKMENVAEGYDWLAGLAESGDDLAAIALSRALDICSGIHYRTEEEYQSVIDGAAQTQTYERIDRRGNVTVEIANEWTWRNLEINFNKCRGVTDEMANEGVKWLWQAADLGNAVAAAQLGAHLGNNEVGRQYLRQALEDGYYEAAHTLGRLFMGCPIAGCGRGPSLDTSDQELILGFAYMHVHLMLVDADPFSGSSRYIAMLETHLDIYRDHLSARQIDESMVVAKKLVTELSAGRRLYSN